MFVWLSGIQNHGVEARQVRPVRAVNCSVRCCDGRLAYQVPNSCAGPRKISLPAFYIDSGDQPGTGWYLVPATIAYGKKLSHPLVFFALPAHRPPLAGRTGAKATV